MASTIREMQFTVHKRIPCGSRTSLRSENLHTFEVSRVTVISSSDVSRIAMKPLVSEEFYHAADAGVGFDFTHRGVQQQSYTSCQTC